MSTESRLNAVRHGLTAREFVCSPEEAAAFASHTAAIVEHYAPAGPIEISLAHKIAAAMWRLDRALAIEAGIFALQEQPAPSPEPDPSVSAPSDPLASARAWLANDRSLALLTVYEQRIQRRLSADKVELRQLQEERRRQTPAPPAAEPKSVCSTPSAPAETKPLQAESTPAPAAATPAPRPVPGRTPMLAVLNSIPDDFFERLHRRDAA